MEETELDFEESLEGIGEQEEAYESWDQELSPVEIPVKRRTRKKKLVIPEGAHPIEVFCLTKDFTIAEVAGISKLHLSEILEIIKGDIPTDNQRKRLRLTTGITL